jgi:hypothetical protein
MEKKILVALLILLVILSLISVYIFLNYPSKNMSEAEKEAAIAKILGRKPNLTDNTPQGETEYKGKYIYFKYPSAAIIRKQLLNGEEVPYNGLELFIFKIESTKLTLYMEVIEAPTNVASLTDYPSVKLRQIQSNSYSEEDVFVGDVKGLAFAKQSTSSFDKTAFFFLNGRIYSFSFQSPDSKEVEKQFKSIISSVKFL